MIKTGILLVLPVITLFLSVAMAQPSHELWDQLLRENVEPSGNVDYVGFQKQENKLTAYLNLLSKGIPSSQWERSDAMAYWINAYNAYTIQLILNHYPVKTIKDIHGGQPWDVKWIKLEDNLYSLNQIENEILRPKYKDPRIHFAVNCAAQSCPPIANQAFSGSNLDLLLEDRTKTFIQNQDYNEIKKNAIRISRIFEWYASDFNDLIGFLNQYSKVQIAKNASIGFQEYNWALNQ